MLDNIKALAGDYQRDGVVHLPGVLDLRTQQLVAQLYEWSMAHPTPSGCMMYAGSDGAFYQDLSNPYWQTPSAWVKPLESWGDGDVRLIELPTNNEAMDNVVAFFEPRDPPRAGEHREIAYTLSWDLQEEEELSLNHVTATRIGEIGAYPDTRRFVIDFDGPTLRDLPSVAPVVAEITSSGNGYVTENQCFKNVISGGWRVAFALDTEDDNVSPVELRCVLRDSESGLPLTETWSYQWSP